MNSKENNDKHIEKVKFEVAQEIGLQRNCAIKENRKKSERK